jgi:hypothetical protein
MLLNMVQSLIQKVTLKKYPFGKHAAVTYLPNNPFQIIIAHLQQIIDLAVGIYT